MNWQLVIIILYFVLTMAIGILASRKTKSSDSFVGAGMGVFAIVCVACGQCEGVCPQHLPIIQLMQEAAAKLDRA